MSKRREHLQGLQTVNGTYSKNWESRGWIGTFIIREAILMCPDNLNRSEEYIYFNSIGSINVSPTASKPNLWIFANL